MGIREIVQHRYSDKQNEVPASLHISKNVEALKIKMEQVISVTVLGAGIKK